MKFLRRGGGGGAKPAASASQAAAPESANNADNDDGNASKKGRPSRNQVEPEVAATESKSLASEKRDQGQATTTIEFGQTDETAPGKQGET